MTSYSRFAVANLGFSVSPERVRHLPDKFVLTEGTIYELLSVDAAKDDTDSTGVTIVATYGAKDASSYYDAMLAAELTRHAARHAAKLANENDENGAS